MIAEPYEQVLGAGQTLVIDVARQSVPFTWTVTSDDWSGTTVRYDGSISKAPEDWVEPEQNASITGDVKDYELDPIRFMRFRHQAGASDVTIRIYGLGGATARSLGS